MGGKFGERLRHVRKRKKMSQKLFGSKIGLSLQSVHRLEQSDRWPHDELLVKLMDEFECDPKWLLTGRGLSGEDGACVPVLKNLEMDGDESGTIGSVCLPGVPSSGSAVRVEGDDMMPTIRNGDYVMFVDVELSEGDLVLFRNKWKELRVRRVSFSDGEELIAEHPEMPPVKIDGSVKIVGRVTQLLRHIVF